MGRHLWSLILTFEIKNNDIIELAIDRWHMSAAYSRLLRIIMQRISEILSELTITAQRKIFKKGHLKLKN